MAQSIKFSSDEFRSLMAVFNMLKDNCHDITIKDGYIHQMNDKKTILYDIDLNSFFNGSTIFISDLLKQFSLLNMFAISNNEVILKIDDKKYYWIDKKSKIEVIIPEESSLRPAYMNPNAKNIQNIKSATKKIFDTIMDRTILDRINQSSRALESENICLSVEEDTAKFIIIPSDMLVSTKMEVHSVDELNDENFNCSANFDIKSFLIKTEELNLTLYKNNSFENAFTLFYKAEIENIPVSMWVLSRYTNN